MFETPLAFYIYGVGIEYYLVMLPALLLGLYAQWLVKSRISAMHEMPNRAGLTGAQTALRILQQNGISNVRVEETSGWLSDHYSPGEKVLRLSHEIFAGRSVSSLAVAAHEVGHAIQDAKGYPALILRSTIAPFASWGSMLGMLLIPVGFMMASLALIKIGLILFATMVFFSLVTLPVEFDASRRAMNELERMGLAGGDDWTAARKVLNAAALTYVASTIQLVLQLLYFAWRAGLIGGGRSDDRAEA
jgi:hypothetical protein